MNAVLPGSRPGPQRASPVLPRPWPCPPPSWPGLPQALPLFVSRSTLFRSGPSLLRCGPGFPYGNPAACALDPGWLPSDSSLVGSVRGWTRASLTNSCQVCIRSERTLPNPHATSPKPRRKMAVSRAELCSRPLLVHVGTGNGRFGREMHHFRSGPGQERSGLSQPCSGTGLDFAARSGSSRGGDRCQRCAATVSADVMCRKRSTTRASSRASTAGASAPVRVCAVYCAPAQGLARSERFVEPSRSSPGAVRAIPFAL